MDYGAKLTEYWELVVDSFKFTLKHKNLWILGFFATVFSASSSLNIDSSSDTGDNRVVEGMSQAIEEFTSSPEFVIFLVVGLVLLLIYIVIAWYVGSSAKIALIKAAVDKPSNNDGKFKIKALWKKSQKFLLRKLGLNLIALGVMIFMMFVFVVPMMVLMSLLGPAGVLLMCCLVPVLAVLSLVLGVPYAIVMGMALRLIVIGDKGVIESIKEAWDLLKSNFVSLALAFLAGLVPGVLSGLITGIVYFITIIPFVIIVMATLVGEAYFLTAMTAVCGACGIVLIISVIYSPARVMFEAYWTNVLMRIRKG